MDTADAPGYLTLSGSEPGNPREIGDAYIELLQYEFTYDGQECVPDVLVEFDGATLVEGEDYEISCKDNVNAGTATVTVRGIGSYVGEAVFEFEIVPADIWEAVIDPIPAQVYGGEPVEPMPTVTFGGRVLEFPDDYEVSYEDNDAPGVAYVIVTGVGNFTGEQAVDFEILDGASHSVADATITLSQTEYVYDGGCFEPEVTVELGGNQLFEEQDYFLRYENNVNAGTATVIVEGTGDYEGEQSVTFTILPLDMSNAVIDPIATQVFEGVAVTPKPVVTLDDYLLAEGDEFEFSYANNDRLGIATVTATGKDNYTGSVSAEFLIVRAGKIPITDAKITLSQTEYVYDGSECRPDVTVEYGGATLAQYLDYDLYYMDNTSAGSATVVVQGVGAYEDDVGRHFTILPTAPDISTFSDVRASTAHANDITWLAAYGVSAGWDMADGTKQFRPYANVARADMAAFLFRLAKGWRIVDNSWQPRGMVTFRDVNKKTPHYREVMWLAESGISQGWDVEGGKEFRPYAKVARADMAAFLFRLAMRAGMVSGSWQPSGTASFSDVNPKTPHYREVMWLAESGISQGWTLKNGKKEFRPYANVARADMAAFLHRLDGLR